MTDVSKWDKANNDAFIECLDNARRYFDWLNPHDFLRFASAGVATDAANEYIVERVNRELCDKTCVFNDHDNIEAKLVFKTHPNGSRTYKMIYYAGKHIQHEHDTWLAALKLHKIELQETQDKIKQLQDEIDLHEQAVTTAQECSRGLRDLLDNCNYDTLYRQFMSEKNVSE